MGDRKTIGADASRRLWVAAGGRCEYRGCNRYLLEDELTGYALNLAEQAHVVGASDGTRSPRSDSSLSPVERAEEPNLMLLCGDHHKVIDRLVAEHGVDGLLEMKREHEKRIRLLTGFTEERETVVIRVFGAIRGAPVEVPPAAVAAAVRAEGRYPRYRLALTGEDLEIDLRQLPGEGDEVYWRAGERMIAQRIAQLRGAQRPLHHLSVFALARIPLLVALGYHLDDKVPTAIHGRRRDGSGDAGWGYDPEAKRVDFSLNRIATPNEDGRKVLLAASLTGPIGEEAVSLADGSAVYEIAPSDRDPGRDLFSARGSLDAFASTYHRFLTTVECRHPECETIHAYLAIPTPAAVQIGRGLMREAQPQLVVFDRDLSGTFQPTVKLGGSTAGES